MSMMGKISFFLGLQISQSPKGIFISQPKYASEIVKKYGLTSTDSVDTPMIKNKKLDEDLQGKLVDATLYHGMIGSLMYLTASRPDLISAVCFCAQYQAMPIENWSSKKQKSTAISSIEAEYIALSVCCSQILWMRSQLTDYGFQFNKIPLYCDNKSGIALCCNNVQHSRAKHIDVCYHFIKEQGKLVDATLYHGMIGSLMYLTASRPDLISAVCFCAQYQAMPIENWSSKKQKSTAISSIEAEYIALSVCCSQILWMRSQLTDYGFQFNKIPLYCDNKSGIALCCNNVQHSRAKHIDVCYHFIKEQVKNGIVELYFVRTEYQLADIFTKPWSRERFNFLIDKLGMKSMSPDTLKHLAEKLMSDGELIIFTASEMSFNIDTKL
nr:retrotransposon protein, putative, unclassified [Tanacetum cinerariifolium]